MAERYATLTIPVRGPFCLTASTRFLEGFAPAAHNSSEDGHLHLAFPVEGEWAPVGICVRQPDPGGEVVADVYGPHQPDPETVATQLARILSLDIDGSGFLDVGERDPVIADLQAQTPGSRPVCFYSPYEAACWAIISHRIRITAAATIKRTIARRYGTTADIHGLVKPSFPAPGELLEIVDDFDGLWPVKQQRLGNVAEAALDGYLDARRLRDMTTDRALEHLQQLPGIGPFSAELILLRGAGHPDHVPSQERRLVEAVGHLYGIDDPSVEDLHELSEDWRPYRTWCAVLVRFWYEQQRASR